MSRRDFSVQEAQELGRKISVDWKQIPIDEFRRGLSVELEHGAHDAQTDVTGDDLVMTAKIALAHLKEYPDYYTRLEKMERDADAYWSKKR